MRDEFGRNIRYMRISVTDLCNMRCVYCMPGEGVSKLRHGDILSIEEIECVARAAASLGVNKIRLTGGEPLVRRGILSIVERVANVRGINEVCMTTNGITLASVAKQLRSAGLTRLNISLDTLRADRYQKITRTGSLSDVLSGVHAARDAGFTGIKINAVLIGGFNDDEAADFLELTRNTDTEVRFIELMPMDVCAGWDKECFVTADAILAKLPALSPIEGDGVAERYRAAGHIGAIGLIRPMSRHFCPTCDRIRVTADGKLKPCLHTANEISLKGLSETATREALAFAISQKPERHHLSVNDASLARRDMNQIGG